MAVEPEPKTEQEAANVARKAEYTRVYESAKAEHEDATVKGLKSVMQALNLPVSTGNKAGNWRQSLYSKANGAKSKHKNQTLFGLKPKEPNPSKPVRPSRSKQYRLSTALSTQHCRPQKERRWRLWKSITSEGRSQRRVESIVR